MHPRNPKIVEVSYVDKTYFTQSKSGPCVRNISLELRPSLHGGKPSVLEKIRGTLNMSKTLHISISPKLLYKSYSLATLEHSKPLLLENYFSIFVLTPDL